MIDSARVYNDLMPRTNLLASILAATSILMAVPTSAESAHAPDTIFVNGHFVTLDASSTIASSVAVQDGRFLRVGKETEIRGLADPATKVVDLRGRTVLPGFVDGHAHPSLAVRMIEKYVDGRNATTPSVAALLGKIRARAAQVPAGEWIIVAGSSSSQTRYAERRLPTKAELDAAAPRNPAMFLNGAHEAVTNSAGLAALGIGRGMSSLAGAHIVLDDHGEPTGVFQEGMALFPDRRIPDDDLRAYYGEVIPRTWNAQGYTSIYALAPLPEIAVIRERAAKGPVALRYTFGVFTDPGGKLLPKTYEALTMPAGVDPSWYRFSGVKVWVDSDLPMRGGAVTQAYAGPAGGHGILNTTQAELDALALNAYRAGVPFLAHATGDRATAMALDAFAAAQREAGPGRALQRIEHFGEFMLGPDDIARARQLGVKVNVQPGWIWTLTHSTIENLGVERARGAFRFRSMIDGGLEPGMGTDLTGIVLETLNPFLHVWAAVTRNSDAGLFVPEQAVSVDEALRMLTIWSARAQQEDAIKGSIEPGKLADMIVISDDILKIPPAAIRDLKVLQTIVGGQVVYDATWSPPRSSRTSAPKAVTGGEQVIPRQM